MAVTTAESKIILTAEDKTGAALKAAISHMEALEKSVKATERVFVGASDGLKRMVGGLDRSATDISKFSRSLNGLTKSLKGVEIGMARVAAAGKSGGFLGSVGGRMGNSISGAFAGITVAGVVAKTFHSSATIQDAELKMRMAGIPDHEREALKAQAESLAQKNPTVGIASIMDLQRETRSFVQHPEEVQQLMPKLARAKALIDFMDPSGNSSHGLAYLVKGMEQVGATQDPARFEKLLDGYLRGMQVMGTTISPEQIADFDKYMKAAAGKVSDRFLMTTGLSLAQEFGGSTAGNSLAMFHRQIIRGFDANNPGGHAALKYWVDAGLIDKNDVDYDKNKKPIGLKKYAKIKNQSIADHDPDYYLWDVVIPALKSIGIKDEDMQTTLAKMFPNQSAGNFVDKLYSQGTAFKIHAERYGEALGDHANDLLPASASNQASAVYQSLTDLLGVAASPAMWLAAQGMKALADGFRSLTEAAKEHPIGGMTALGGRILGMAGGGYYLGRSAFRSIGRLFGVTPSPSGGLADSAAPELSPKEYAEREFERLTKKPVETPQQPKNINPGIIGSFVWPSLLFSGSVLGAIIDEKWTSSVNEFTIEKANEYLKKEREERGRLSIERDHEISANRRPASSDNESVRLELEVKPTSGFFDFIIKNFKSTPGVSLDYSGPGTVGRSFDDLVGP